MVTDSELNRAMATALGWRNDGTWNGEGVDTGENWYDPKRERTAPSTKPPDFCRDRNVLPQIWQAIRSANKVHPFLDRIVNQIDGCGFAAKGHGMTVLTSEPREQVEAALRCLGAWQPAWDAPASGQEGE